MDEENIIELLEFYNDMFEKQEEIIYRMGKLLKDYAYQLHNSKTVYNYMDENPGQQQEAAILDECIKEYESMKGP